jgi:hypothetical protein
LPDQLRESATKPRILEGALIDFGIGPVRRLRRISIFVRSRQNSFCVSHSQNTPRRTKSGAQQ